MNKQNIQQQMVIKTDYLIKVQRELEFYFLFFLGLENDILIQRQGVDVTLGASEANGD